jgi:hypothetical protein
MVGKVGQVGPHRRKPRVFVPCLTAEIGHSALPPLADRVAFGRFVLGIPILLSIAPQVMEATAQNLWRTAAGIRREAGSGTSAPASGRSLPSAAATGSSGTPSNTSRAWFRSRISEAPRVNVLRWRELKVDRRRRRRGGHGCWRICLVASFPNTLLGSRLEYVRGHGLPSDAARRTSAAPSTPDTTSERIRPTPPRPAQRSL